MSDLVMPKLGLTMTEGLLAEWRVTPGQSFAAGDILFVVETEKVANEIEAAEAGTLGEILVEAGETVPVGTPVARLAGGKGATAVPTAPVNAAPAEAAPVEAAPMAPAPSSPAPACQEGRVVATPLARRLARDKGIDLASLTGTGPRGRIKASDVTRAAEAAPPSAASPAASATTAPATREEPLSATRIAVAQRVTAAKPGIPHFYVTHEAEISALKRLRHELNAEAGRPRISMTHLLIKALGLTLAEMPAMNRIWLDDRILGFEQVDIGMVAETPQGLRIPVLRDVGSRPLDQVAAEASALAARARDGSLAASDVGGGALSISNVGMFGVTSLTPIISPPQAMILGVGAERALFRPDAEGKPVARHELVLTLACDHRIIDGAEAARFLAAVVATLEHPLRLLRPARPAAAS